MSESLSISFPKDSEGFISQECPSCTREFKVEMVSKEESQEADKTLSYCPYCGFNGQSCWWTPAQVDYIQGQAIDRFVNPELRNFRDDINRSGEGFVRVSMSDVHDRNVPPAPESERTMNHFTFTCCDEKLKYDGDQANLYCIICGKSTVVAGLA